MRILKWVIGAFVAGLAASAPGHAGAGTISDCVTIDPVVLSQAYNPFTTATSVQTMSITVRRQGNANPRTQAVNFVFVQPQNDATPYQIKYGASNVLYPYPGPILSVSGPNPDTIGITFGGATGNSQVVTINFTMPAGANLPAGNFAIPFGIDARCVLSGNGGTVTGTLVDPFTISLTVRSALQAYFAGPALDFGAIGSVSDIAAPSHFVNGYIHVSSSGPYSVALSSGNNFRMTFPGGNLSAGNQRVGYRLSFLGQNRDVAAPTFATVNCHQSGISGGDLAIKATLQDGGAGKTPAPNYQDILTVTITPLVVPPADTYAACS